MSEDQSAIFKDYAEKKVGDMVKENQAILNQLHALEWAAEEMSRDKKMTAKAWQRVIKGFHEQRKKTQLQTKINYQHPIEEAMVKNLRNQLGISFQMAAKNEEMMELAKRELANMRQMAEANQKAAQEASKQSEFKFESVEAIDSVKSVEGEK